VRSEVLVDTGAILALLDRRDHWHRACVDAYRNLRLPLLTSEAVLTELFHLLDFDRRAVERGWKLLESGMITMGSIENSELSSVHELMVRYEDRPMDFADATLVYLARRESISTVFTVDHNDFETYRIEGKRRFRIVPDRRT
jgi:hypothetical protein